MAVVAVCYIADQFLMSVSMARATWLQKIARDPAHVTPALTASTSIDHIFSISTAVVSGLIWQAWGYRFVFLLGAAIAVVNLISTMFIVVPKKPIRPSP